MVTFMRYDYAATIERKLRELSFVFKRRKIDDETEQVITTLMLFCQIIDNSSLQNRGVLLSLFRECIYDSVLAEKVDSIQELPGEPGIEQAFAELYQIIQHCSYSVKRKIPDKFIEFIRKNMDEQWKGDLDFSLNLNEMKLLSDTRAMISLIYRDFLCTETERKELIEKDRKKAEASGYHYEGESLKDLIELMDLL